MGFMFGSPFSACAVTGSEDGEGGKMNAHHPLDVGEVRYAFSRDFLGGSKYLRGEPRDFTFMQYPARRHNGMRKGVTEVRRFLLYVE
jgi:hypothetical protein